MIKEWLISNIKVLLITSLSIITPVAPLILTVLFLTLLDFIFAIYKQYRIDSSKITSRKMGNTISKILLYTLTILGVFFLETYIIGDVLPITKIVAGIISLTEVKSLDETFKDLLGYSIWDLLVKIATRGTSNTKDIIDVLDGGNGATDDDKKDDDYNI